MAQGTKGFRFEYEYIGCFGWKQDTDAEMLSKTDNEYMQALSDRLQFHGDPAVLKSNIPSSFELKQETFDVSLRRYAVPPVGAVLSALKHHDPNYDLHSCSFVGSWRSLEKLGCTNGKNIVFVQRHARGPLFIDRAPEIDKLDDFQWSRPFESSLTDSSKPRSDLFGAVVVHKFGDHKMVVGAKIDAVSDSFDKTCYQKQQMENIYAIKTNLGKEAKQHPDLWLRSYWVCAPNAIVGNVDIDSCQVTVSKMGRKELLDSDGERNVKERFESNLEWLHNNIKRDGSVYEVDLDSKQLVELGDSRSKTVMSIGMLRAIGVDVEGEGWTSSKDRPGEETTGQLGKEVPPAAQVA